MCKSDQIKVKSKNKTIDIHQAIKGGSNKEVL